VSIVSAERGGAGGGEYGTAPAIDSRDAVAALADRGQIELGICSPALEQAAAKTVGSRNAAAERAVISGRK
jgi:hypothetical protein